MSAQGLNAGCLLVLWSLELTLTMAAEPKHYTATTLWQFRIFAGSQSSPSVGHDGIIYVGTWAGDLLALSDGGT